MSENSLDKKIELGRVGKARGLRGEFFVSGRTEPWASTIKTVWLGKTLSSAVQHRVQFIKQNNQKLFAKIEGLDSRETIEVFTGQTIWCRRQDIKFDTAKEYLWSDLIGLQVQDKDGELLGKVARFENHGIHDNVVLQCHTGGKKFLDLPFVRQYFDLDFVTPPSQLRCLAAGEDVADLWYEV